MDIRLLGPVEVTVDDRRVSLGPPQRRAVLAALAVDVNQAVSLGTLIERVWDLPPGGATDSLYAHIARLRRALTGTGARIERRGGGYALEVDPDRVDAYRFRRLAKEAQSLAADDLARAALLAEAMDLWCGSPLTGIPGDWAARMRYGIEQQFVGAVVAWAHAHLRMGRPDLVVTELTPLVPRYPLAEPLASMLMRGLRALGRTAEAVALYARLRRYLTDHLGIEPGPELRALHQELLRGGPGPLPARAAGRAGARELRLAEVTGSSR
ncbi:BTAD domain-containing putative transcriptional regulator [Sphaerisporangium sp. TRM90804]|uniref:AfsR/SARP family transcriptional regulator n=1 Tax=Sphaerisporangium sp. TRM90804 TaxID=3031113 RepID=UPI00244A09FA|nr:BTAD domain-containing putative transcriptional regulator [Sphaerisporangium sp. TRM90804]MDH2427102.1 BTAD domain-containing putative transcriptional regulator [Sphaerisporangium sp. TRM90804]